MITRDDLMTNAQFRGILFLDMARGAYQNHYRSMTYPRLEVVKEGGPRVGKKQKYDTTYYVDGVECPDIDAVLARLNAEPWPPRSTGQDAIDWKHDHERDLRRED